MGSLETTTETENKVQGGLFLDVIISQSPSIFQLLSSKDQPLLIWWDALLVLNLGFHIVNSVRAFHLQSNGLSSQGLHKYLHPTPQPQDQMKGRLLLNVVISKGAAILQLLSSEDKPLLIWGNSFFVLDFLP